PKPGAPAHVCAMLGAGHISIEYAYCGSGGRNGKTFGIFKVSNSDKAIRLLNGSPNQSALRRLGRRPVRDLRTYQARGAAVKQESVPEVSLSPGPGRLPEPIQRAERQDVCAPPLREGRGPSARKVGLHAGKCRRRRAHQGSAWTFRKNGASSAQVRWPWHPSPCLI